MCAGLCAIFTGAAPINDWMHLGCAVHTYLSPCSPDRGCQPHFVENTKPLSFLSAMDHEKPQPVSQFTMEFVSGEMSRSTDYSDLQHGRTPSIIDLDEVEQVDETRERRGESVWYGSG